MNRPAESPLILGGHSFISQLGNDPPASPEEQHGIVASCLDQGITWFDTTYQPERVALGNMLATLERRDEATILAWNFFTDFAPGDPSCGEHERFRPEHIDVILDQLRTPYVDGLIVVPLDDPEANLRQVELMIEWRTKGYVRFLGIWARDIATMEPYRKENPFRFAIRPFNITTGDAAPVFGACKALGCETIATSPFFRGWELDRIVTEATARGYGEAETLRARLADLMLRYSLFQNDVDRLIVAMRRVEWIPRNLESVRRGPLAAEESRELRRLRSLATGKHRWWHRFGRRF